MVWEQLKPPLTCLQVGQHPLGHDGRTVPLYGESGLVACHLTTERERGRRLYGCMEEREGEKGSDF